MMHMAIINNRVDFVRLLLENGISLREFLTVDELLKLYNDVRLKLFNLISCLFLLHILAFITYFDCR